MSTTSRREFLATVISGTAAAALTGCAATGGAGAPAATRAGVMDLVLPKMDRVRFGVIGLGQRGGTLLPLLLGVEGAEVAALCDTDAPALEEAVKLTAAQRGSAPAKFTGGDEAYRALLERSDVDAVIIATPWEWHVPMAVHAMQAGKQTFVEVPAAMTLEDCWRLVEVSERMRVNCMMMENVCYGRSEMMVLNMVRDGLLGELTHGEGAYIHDLRWQMKEIERGTGSWRTPWHAKINGNLYPTHGLGPIAQYMNVNRGDRFDYLASVSSPSLAFKAYAQREFPAGHARNTAKYINGDINSSLIKTQKGRSILVQHDTATPRPYSRINLIQGTNGAFSGYPDRIALENNPLAPGKLDGFHAWDADMEKWLAKYDHPIWRKMLDEATRQGGHGGMDFVMLWRMVYCLRNALPLDQNVYDAAAWSAVTPLSVASVARRGNSQDVPDFTRGAWMKAPPLTMSM